VNSTAAVRSPGLVIHSQDVCASLSTTHGMVQDSSAVDEAASSVAPSTPPMSAPTSWYPSAATRPDSTSATAARSSRSGR
jgi:hypothetical protein